MKANDTPLSQADTRRIAEVRSAMREAGDELRRRYPILRHQDAIGASIMGLSLLGMIGTGALYAYGFIAWWICIPVVAIFASFTHELEHDLIHLMYFRDRKWANDLMLLLGWIARPSTGSPWMRRRLHLHHHKFSGTNTDLEEQAITNGEPWGLRRLLMTGDLGLAVILRPLRMARLSARYVHAQTSDRRERRKIARKLLLNYFPFTFLYQGLMLLFLGYHGAELLGAYAGLHFAPPAGLQHAMPVVDLLAVTWLLPNTLRTFCLHFISSNMHYYGDIQANNPIQQTQVLNAWWLLPFQLFCFNFGSTHAIHHFVVKETFYIRQMTARRGHEALRQAGVRFNDLGTFRRSNRYAQAAVTAPLVTAVAKG
jgi:fatty acid desaturase